MPATATGSLALNTAAFATLLANVPFFQTWTGTANPTDASARIFIGEVGFPITSVTIQSGVMTVVTRDQNTLGAGQTIEIAGASTEAVSIDGAQTIASIVNGTTFTISTALGNLATVNPDQAFIVPCPRPIAVIAPTPNALNSDSIGTGGISIVRGAVDVLFEADVSSQYQNDPFNAAVELESAYGSLCDGIMALQETLDYMAINRHETAMEPEFTNPVEQDNNTIRFERWRAMARFHWGMNA